MQTTNELRSEALLKETIKLINKFNPALIIIFGTSLLCSKYLDFVKRYVCKYLVK